MHGLMQDRPLTLPMLFHRAEQLFGHKRVICGARVRSIAQWAVRVRRLATALDALGVPAGARVGTFCTNTDRHFELYAAVPCAGRVLHTLNIRLFAEQITYIANHAADDVLFAERSLRPVLWPLIETFETVRKVVVIDDGGGVDVPDDPRILDYEELLAAAEPHTGRFGVEDENSAAVLCYTSGTTGSPKGVLYSHRSTVLHAMVTLTADVFGLRERDVVLPVVPMFHVNAWGLPYGALLAGADLVLPGPDTSPEALCEQLAGNRVTVTGGVPTIWMGIRPLLADHDLSALRVIACGGALFPSRCRRRIGRHSAYRCSRSGA